MLDSRTISAFCLLSSLCLGACSLADIRPEDGATHENAPGSEARGRALLKRMSDAAGGRAAFLSAETAKLTVSDHWPGWFARTFFSPWEQDGQHMQLDVRLGADDGRLTFLEGERKGSGWGLQQWVTYRFDTQGELTFDDPADVDDAIKFWIPTLQYFFVLPFRIEEANVIRHLGQAEAEGKTYERVYATWGQPSAQEDIDQYVLWLDPNTGMLRWLQYTVRDFGGFIEGAARYDEYKQHGPLWLPKTVTVVTDGVGDREGVMHQMRLHEAEIGVTFPPSHLVPKPSLRAHK